MDGQQQRSRLRGPRAARLHGSITNVQIQSNADDGGNQTAGDFQLVSQNCSGAGGVGPIAPGGTCAVDVAFRPSRTNYTSVARLQNAMERVLLAAKSTGEAVETVAGDASLTVTDPGVAPGHLVNGSFSLPQAPAR